MRSSILMHGRASIVWIAFVAASVGCSAPTRPDELSGVTLQTASPGSSDAPSGAIFPPAILVEGRDVVVLGILTTPCLGYSIAASAVKSGNLVTITLTARQLGNGCLTAIREFAYRATVPLSRGTYSVEVVYEYPGTSLPTEVVSKSTIVVS